MRTILQSPDDCGETENFWNRDASAGSETVASSELSNAERTYGYAVSLNAEM